MIEMIMLSLSLQIDGVNTDRCKTSSDVGLLLLI
jgi:hypothetical protein